MCNSARTLSFSINNENPRQSSTTRLSLFPQGFRLENSKLTSIFARVPKNFVHRNPQIDQSFEFQKLINRSLLISIVKIKIMAWKKKLTIILLKCSNSDRGRTHYAIAMWAHPRALFYCCLEVGKSSFDRERPFPSSRFLVYPRDRERSRHRRIYMKKNIYRYILERSWFKSGKEGPRGRRCGRTEREIPRFSIEHNSTECLEINMNIPMCAYFDGMCVRVSVKQPRRKHMLSVVIDRNEI